MTECLYVIEYDFMYTLLLYNIHEYDCDYDCMYTLLLYTYESMIVIEYGCICTLLLY